MQRHYGLIRQSPDPRDAHFNKAFAPIAVPPSVDLRPNDVPIYDQGQLGSCTANAICAAYLFDHKKQFGALFAASRLFVYYYERFVEGTVTQDAGAQIRDGFKVIAKYGIAESKYCPYDISRFTEPPTPAAVQNALTHHSVLYGAVPQTLTTLKRTLAQGFPVVIGITVYASFESNTVAGNGIVPMPADGEQEIGGHAVCIVGYDDTRSVFIVRNSWGETWGDHGYFYLPYAYVTDPNLASDFWAVELVTR